MQSVIDKVHDSKSLIVAEPEKSVLKATRHEMAPPKEKHVRKVVLYCNNNNPIAPLHSALDHRLRATAAWPVTLSTLVLYHRVLRDCPYRVMDFFRSRPLSVVPDPPTSEDCPQCYFASLYSRYIDSKIIISKVVGNCAWDKEEATKLQNLPQARLLEVSDTLISSLEALVRCYCADEIRSWEENIDPITVAALVLLVKDSVSLYKYVNMCLLSILESYFNMDLVSARQSLKLLQSFETCTKHLNKLYHCCSRFIENLETLDVPQKSLIPTLEAYIQTKEREDNNTRTQVRAAMPSSAEQVVFQPPPSSSTTRPLTSSGNVTIKPPSTSTTASPRQRDLLDFNDFTPQPSPQSLQQSPMRSQPFPPQNFQVSEQNLVLQQQQQQQQQLLQLQQEQLRLQQIQMQQQSNLFFSPSTPSSSSFSSTGFPPSITSNTSNPFTSPGGPNLFAQASSSPQLQRNPFAQSLPTAQPQNSSMFLSLSSPSNPQPSSSLSSNPFSMTPTQQPQQNIPGGTFLQHQQQLPASNPFLSPSNPFLTSSQPPPQNTMINQQGAFLMQSSPTPTTFNQFSGLSTNPFPSAQTSSPANTRQTSIGGTPSALDLLF